jgi:hypothetical protein
MRYQPLQIYYTSLDGCNTRRPGIVIAIDEFEVDLEKYQLKVSWSKMLLSRKRLPPQETSA